MWNNKKYITVRTVPNSNRKIVERAKIDTLTPKYNTVHWLGTGISVKSGEANITKNLTF